MPSTKIENLQHRALERLIHRLGRLRRDCVDVGDVSMPFVTAGSGEPVLFLHGFADQKETWSIVGRLLSDRFQIVAPDLPGFGVASRVPPSHTGTRALARYVVQFLDALGLDKVHMVGNSMGGGVAQRVAYHQPGRVHTLTLICSLGPTLLKSAIARLGETTEKNPLIPRSHEEYLEMLDWVFARKPPIPAVVMRHVARRQVARADDFTQYLRALEDDWDWDAVGLATQPTLIVQGSRDRVIHPSTARGLADELPNARLLMLSGTGHAPQWEQPAVIARALAGFFQRNRMD